MKKTLALIGGLAFVAAACSGGRLPDSDPSDQSPPAEAAIQLAMQFETGRDLVGTPEAYVAHPSGLPLPEYTMVYGSVFTWHQDPELQAEFLTNLSARASALGIRKVLLTPTAVYREELETRFEAGTIPPLDELVRRPWVSEDEPGFLEAIEAQRDTLAALIGDGVVDSIILRPFQEAGSGIHDNAGLTPERYRELIEWLVDDVYVGMPIDTVIVHWNTIDGLVEALPELDDDSIEVYAGVTISMPSHGAMAAIEMLETEPQRVLEQIRERDPDLAEVALEQGIDFASRAWAEAGVDTWIAEFSVFDDGRTDELTGWSATGLTDPSVIPNFFEHYRRLRETGHIAGITWLNKTGFTGRDVVDPNLKDTRWDGDTVYPDVRDWWINEITSENGYDVSG